ncbi:hypothetical protein [Mycolicibacterium septicum]|uniref:hypothetical protein n=1 Tax=Mycolicibacterium septicum TaxID=98668 RepID=UPI002362B2FC|nr:hypothetical protein [Mycolicibacterium septicum]
MTDPAHTTSTPANGAESAPEPPEPATPTQPTRRKPIRYDAATATPRLQAAIADAASIEAAHTGDLCGGDTDTDDDPHPNQGSETETPDTGREFTDAFKPDHDALGLTAEEYQAAAEVLAAEADEAAEETEPAQSAREARYRVRLRAAENEVGRLQSLVEAMQRNEIQRMAEGRLADPGDLFVDFAVHDCLDDTDTVDPARVDTIIGKCLEAHPHWAIPRQPYTGPLHSGASEQAATGSAWRDAFAPQPHERG